MSPPNQCVQVFGALSQRTLEVMLDPDATAAQDSDTKVKTMRASFPKRRSDVSAGVVDGETVLLDRKGNLVHQLNQTATYVWERCDGKTSETEVASQLTEVFEVNPKT